MTNIAGYDATSAGLPAVPAGSQVAGYMTGSGDVPWTAEQWAAHPGAVRIDQSPVLTAIDETADVLDVERGAATNAECAAWYRAALANYNSGARPGQRLPAIYTSESNVTPLVNQLIADGVQSGPFLWVAHWGIGLGSAEVILDGSGGPFPITGVQYDNGPSYDYDVWLESWLTTVSAGTPPVEPPQPGPVPPDPVPPAHRNIYTPVLVDGIFGKKTVTAQQFVDFNGNTADCDGIFGINSKKAMQAHLGVKQDGLIGPVTVKALQARVGAVQDGLWGPKTTQALQRALNAGTY